MIPSDYEDASEPEENQEICTPEDIVRAAEEISKNLFPDKSKVKYLNAYNAYKTWQVTKSLHSNSERSLLAYYFGEHKGTSLWPYYSMLKCGLYIKESTDISNFKELRAFLRKILHVLILSQFLFL